METLFLPHNFLLVIDGFYFVTTKIWLKKLQSFYHCRRIEVVSSALNPSNKTERHRGDRRAIKQKKNKTKNLYTIIKIPFFSHWQKKF